MMADSATRDLVAAILTGYTVVVPSDVPRPLLHLALDRFAHNTDWSAFTREDWIAAREWLFTATDEELKS